MGEARASPQKSTCRGPCWTIEALSRRRSWGAHCTMRAPCRPKYPTTAPRPDGGEHPGRRAGCRAGRESRRCGPLVQQSRITSRAPRATAMPTRWTRSSSVAVALTEEQQVERWQAELGAGRARAGAMLGAYLSYRALTESDCAAARDAFVKADELGNDQAPWLLAKLARNDTCGVIVDRASRERWLKKAAALDNPAAAIALIESLRRFDRPRRSGAALRVRACRRRLLGVVQGGAAARRIRRDGAAGNGKGPVRRRPQPRGSRGGQDRRADAEAQRALRAVRSLWSLAVAAPARAPSGWAGRPTTGTNASGISRTTAAAHSDSPTSS